MAKVKTTSPNSTNRKIRPALTPEADENQMISLAMDLVKQRLIDGTASSQETTHFLKLGTTKYRLEKETMMKNMELTDAKIKQIHSEENREALFREAIDAMKKYSGHGGDVDVNEEDY